MQKIVYVVNTLASPGGIERIVLDKITYMLSTVRYEVSVIITTAEQDKKPFFAYPEGLQCLYAPTKWSFIQAVCKTRPDILIFTRPFFEENAIVSLLFPKVHRFVELHACYEIFHYPEQHFNDPSYFDKSFTKMEKRIFPHLAQLVLLTKRDQQLWQEANSCVIANFTQLATQPSSYQAKEKKAIAVGRLVYQKGFDHLIEAWKIVHEKHPDWHLDIYGDGELKLDLQQQIDNLHAEEYVRLCGFTNDMQVVYQQAAFMVMSSLYEGFPMTMVEALTNGLPVVSYDYPSGASEMIVNGVNGYLCQYQNVQDLASKICLMIESTPCEQNKVMQSVAHLTPSVIMPQLYALFDELKDKKHKRTCQEWKDSLWVVLKYLKSRL